jgi:predicted DNA-binding ribbon-helix-helix protein
MNSSLIKHNFTLAGHRTSVALEQDFWAAVMHIAASRHQTLAQLVAAVDAQHTAGQPRASALRVLALQEFFPTHSSHRIMPTQQRRRA